MEDLDMVNKNILSFLAAVTALKLMKNAEEGRREKRLFRKSTLHQKAIIYIIIPQCISLSEDLTVIQRVWIDMRHISFS